MIRSVRRGLALALGGLAIACSYTRHDSLKLVDPALQRDGVRYQQDGRLAGYRLGPYHIEERTLRRMDGERLADLTAAGARHPVEAYEVEVTVAAPERPTWTARCQGQRRPLGDADYAAIADERRDALLVHCSIDDGGADVWTFAAEGLLSSNFSGRLRSANAGDLTFAVDVVMWMERFKLFQRHLPDPVMQIRRADQDPDDERAGPPIAAMLLGPPQLAWVAPDAADRHREVSIALMTAVSRLPLGLDD